METKYMNGSENIYYACRKEAAKYNDKLRSREMAAELLGISTSSLANYELGTTKIVPVDIVVLMSDLYNAPELRYHYCKNECPIGASLPMATKAASLEGITIRLLNGLDADEITYIKKSLLGIARDGKVGSDEIPKLHKIVGSLDDLAETISELRILAEKCEGGID